MRPKEFIFPKLKRGRFVIAFQFRNKKRKEMGLLLSYKEEIFRDKKAKEILFSKLVREFERSYLSK